MQVSELEKIVFDFLDNSSESFYYLSVNSSAMSRFTSMFNDDFIVVDLENPIEKYSPISPFMSVLKKQNLTEQQVEPYTYSLQKNSFLSFHCQ